MKQVVKKVRDFMRAAYRQPWSWLKSLFNKFRTVFVRLVLAIQETPSWLKNRPKAIKTWVIENSKKRKYHSFKLEKKLRPQPRNVPTSWRLSKDSLKFFLKYFWIFFGIMAIHFGLYMLFVYSPPSFNLTQAQDTIKTFFGGSTTSAQATSALLGTIIGAQTQRQGAAMYNFLIILSMSLADIWIIRRLLNKKAVVIREAFYNGMAPVVPVLMILLVMTIQLLPFTIAAYIYTVGRTNGVFISGVEDLTFFLIALAAGLLSFYLMTPSILSIYGATLPNMYPLHTIKLTKKIVQYRRLMVFRRILALPLIVALLYFGLLLLLIRFYPAGGIWFVQIFPIVALPLIHIYLFKLYKSLI